VVPQPDATPLPPPSPFSTPRPAGPQPLFVVPPTPSGSTLRLTKSPRLVWYTTAAAAIGLVALGVALLVSHPAPRDPLPAPPMLQPAPPPVPVATPIAKAPPLVKAPAIAVRPTAPSPVAAPVVHAPPRHHASRPRPAPSSASAPSEPERTVKEGRIVDPFAGLQ